MLKKGCDAAACVPRGCLVIAGPGDLRQEDQQRGRVRGVVIIDEPVARVPIRLDVVIHAEHGQSVIEPGRGATPNRRAVVAAVAADDRARAGQGPLGVLGTAAVVDAGGRVPVPGARATA